MATSVPRLRMSGVSKRFGATQALSDVSLDVLPGRVRALIGENGAGKSTLMKILAGVFRADDGQMLVDGQPYHPGGPAAARAAGVAMIHQELSLAPHLSVEANILLGQERSYSGWVRRQEHRQLARHALARLLPDELPLDMPAGRLPIAQQQCVEIARALVSQARVLVFDEPTSSLTESDAQRLLRCIRDLRSAGIGIVYISHFLEEVAAVADDFTVLRDGRVAGEGRYDEVSPQQIVRLMVGRDLDEFFPRVPHAAGDVILEIESLSGSAAPLDAHLTLRRGEIVGLAGLVGAGRSELLRCIFGLDPVRHGRVRVAAQSGRTAWQTSRPEPRASIRHGLGLVSENRKEEGLALSLSVADNLTLPALSRYGRAGWINLRRRDRAVAAHIAALGCRTTGPGQSVAQLSGGNQQKIALARLLDQQADVLLLDEPTRGIDLATKAQIYLLIGQLAAQGKSILMVSSYLPELLNVCDRVGVLCRGQLRAVRPVSQWTEESIMHAATGSALDALPKPGAADVRP